MSLSDARSAQVELHTPNPSLELSLVASGFQVVERGIGGLSVAVKPGIYQIVARAGPVVQRTLIKVSAGEVYRDDQVMVQFPAAAPVTDTSTSHEYQQQAVLEASEAIRHAPGPPGGLVIVIRDVRGLEGPPLGTAGLADISLLDQSLAVVRGFDAGWSIRRAEAIATWRGRLTPGGYALRTDSSTPFDQSLWVSEGWQTIVFVTTGESGPQTATASVHMAPLSDGWVPYEYQVGLALELANWGLREGRSVVPRDLLNLMLNAKFVNPMLGIVGAHCLLLDPDADTGLVTTVLTNLGRLVPGHPDVAALRWIAAREGFVAGPMAGAVAPGQGVSWPPMLLASYRALIEMDVVAEDAIADESPAEWAAAQLYIQGIWTSWTPLAAAPAEAPAADTREAPASVLPTVAGDPSLLAAVPRDDPATARVTAYLAAVAAFEGVDGRGARFAALTPAEIALATTLPAASVERALWRIGGALPPPTGSGGPGDGQPPKDPVKPKPRRRWRDGLTSGTAAMTGAGVLLLAGVAGAVAWCAGNEECPFRGGAPVPTPPPTVLVTRQPTIVQPTGIPLEHPSEVDFGQVAIGLLEPERREFVVRVAPEVLENDSITLSYEIGEGSSPGFPPVEECGWIATDDGSMACTVDITFAPAYEGLHVGTLLIHAGQEDEPRQIPLLGEGIAPELRYQEPFRILGKDAGVPVSQVFFIDTALTPDLAPLTFDILADPGLVFGTSSEACIWQLEPDGTYDYCPVEITFTPPDFSNYEGTLGVYYGAQNPLEIALLGTWDIIR